MHAKSAASRRKSIHRRRVPVVEIKIAESGIGRFAAPRIDSFGSIHRAIGGAMPLRFCRKRLPRPARVCHRLGMTHINWPVQRQRNLFKHATVEPPVASLRPEHGMRDRLRVLPIPILIAPESARFIAASRHEIQKLPVGHFILINLKPRHLHSVSLVLVVPAESFVPAQKAQGYCASRNLDHPRHDSRGCELRQLFLRTLPVERQLMQHVGQRLDMHQAMLNRDIQQGIERDTVAVCTE